MFPNIFYLSTFQSTLGLLWKWKKFFFNTFKPINFSTYVGMVSIFLNGLKWIVFLGMIWKNVPQKSFKFQHIKASTMANFSSLKSSNFPLLLDEEFFFF